MFTIFQEGIGTAGALGTVKDFGLDKLSKFLSHISCPVLYNFKSLLIYILNQIF